VSRCTSVGAVCILVLAVFFTVATEAEALDTLRLTPDRLQPADSIPLWDYWVFQEGDDPAWADPAYPDDDWMPLPDNTGDRPGGWTWLGAGWFRVHMVVSPELGGQAVGMQVYQRGAVEVYLNGRVVYARGRIGSSRESEDVYLNIFGPPTSLTLDTVRHQVLAIRYSGWTPAPFWGAQDLRGVIVAIADLEWAEDISRTMFVAGLRHQTVTVSACVVFCLIHLFAYLFYKRIRANLYFALFTASTALLMFTSSQLAVTHDLQVFHLLHALFKVSVVSTSVFALWTIYILFYRREPRMLWVFAAVGGMLTLAAWWMPRNVIFMYSILTLVEMGRVLVMALVRRIPGARLIGMGFLIFSLSCTWQMLGDFGATYQFGPEIDNYIFMWGTLVLLFMMSVHLARQFANTNRQLEDQLEQVQTLSEKTLEQERIAGEQEMTRKLLEQEVEHQRKELQDARRLAKALHDLKITNRELKSTQTQLVQSEKMAALGQLVAGVAHEINTPVGAISSMHDTMTSAVDRLDKTLAEGCSPECDIPDKTAMPMRVIRDAIRVIASGSSRVTNIVRRLRSFARLDEAELKRADLNEGLEDTLTLLHHELKHDIEVVREYGGIPEIHCYPAQLNQVFLNLLVNARQAIEGKGIIRVRSYLDGDQVCVDVADTGRGISDEHRKHIFDPGFTTKGVGVGTGLGLSICYQIVEQHQGKISVQSKVGEGTTFTVCLPADLDRRLNTST